VKNADASATEAFELQGFARAADIWYHICATGGSELLSSELKRSAMKKGKTGNEIF
jgi:hypothetical protein